LKPHRGEIEKKNANTCPVYVTLARKGYISTLGDSNNFVTTFDLVTEKEDKHWIKRGVALFCQVNI
jgi:dynein heavy chain